MVLTESVHLLLVMLSTQKGKLNLFFPFSAKIKNEK